MTEEQLREIEARAKRKISRGLTLHREALIVQLCEDVPALVAEVRRLQEYIGGLKETLKRIHGRAKSLAEITEVSE